MDKLKEKPKLFSWYVNSKMENRKGMNNLRVNRQMCDGLTEMTNVSLLFFVIGAAVGNNSGEPSLHVFLILGLHHPLTTAVCL